MFERIIGASIPGSTMMHGVVAAFPGKDRSFPSTPNGSEG
jgi:hypothetical protein